MPYCQYCGVSIKTDDKFCSKCGVPVGVGVTPVKGQPASPNVVEDQNNTVNDKNSRDETQLRYKGVGIRFAAQIVDIIILVIFFGISGRFIASFVGGVTKGGFELHGVPAFLLMFVNLAFSVGYFTLMEGKVNGQTIGKMLTGIKVVREDGKPVNLNESFIRNILRLIDALPFFYLVGAISVWSSSQKQRIGDRVAHTVVIKK
ncbi:MAG: RDD family protein [Candidatus Theseobacter exili]|nr:RDD family protein [Candidatus Theseobacter exili]